MSMTVTDWIGPAILRYHAQHRRTGTEWVKSHDPAQVIKFESYRRPNDPTDQSQIQAIISDRVHRIIVLFDPTSTTAKEQSTKEPLTSHLRCILAFQSYRFTLVPTTSLPKPAPSATSTDLSLVLEVRDWTFMAGSKSEPEYYENSRMLGVGETGSGYDWEIGAVVDKWVTEFRSSQGTQSIPVPSTSSYPQPELGTSPRRQNPPKSKNLLPSPTTICSIVKPLLESIHRDPLPPDHKETDRGAWMFEIAGGKEGLKEFQTLVNGIGVWGMDVEADDDEDDENSDDEEEDVVSNEEENIQRQEHEESPSTSDVPMHWSQSPPPTLRINGVLQAEDTSVVTTEPARCDLVVESNEERVATTIAEAHIALGASSPTQSRVQQSIHSPVLAKLDRTQHVEQAQVKDDSLDGHLETPLVTTTQKSDDSLKQESQDKADDSDEVVGASLPDEQSTRPSLFGSPPDLKPVLEPLRLETPESLGVPAVPNQEEDPLSRGSQVEQLNTDDRRTNLPEAGTMSPVPLPTEGLDVVLRPSIPDSGTNDNQAESEEDELMEDVSATVKDVLIKEEDCIQPSATTTILASDSDATASGESQSQGETHPASRPLNSPSISRRRSIPAVGESTRIPRPVPSAPAISTIKNTSSYRRPSPPQPSPPGFAKQPTQTFSVPSFASPLRARLSISKEDRRRSATRQTFTPMPIQTPNKSGLASKTTGQASTTSQSHAKAPLQASKTVRQTSVLHPKRNQLKRESSSEAKPELKRRGFTIELEDEDEGLLDWHVHRAMRLVKKEEGS